MIRRLALCLVLLVASPARAYAPDEVLADPALETRARAITAELRCLVCQNESIDVSQAPLARDLRLLVRERLLAGDSDAEVYAFVTARYGTYVLLRPPVGPATWLLWFGPPVLVLTGLAIVWAIARGRRPADPARERGLTPEEEARLAALLDRRGGES